VVNDLGELQVGSNGGGGKGLINNYAVEIQEIFVPK
jgi:hypothetical protein